MPLTARLLIIFLLVGLIVSPIWLIYNKKNTNSFVKKSGYIVGVHTNYDDGKPSSYRKTVQVEDIEYIYMESSSYENPQEADYEQVKVYLPQNCSGSEAYPSKSSAFWYKSIVPIMWLVFSALLLPLTYFMARHSSKKAHMKMGSYTDEAIANRGERIIDPSLGKPLVSDVFDEQNLPYKEMNLSPFDMGNYSKTKFKILGMVEGLSLWIFGIIGFLFPFYLFIEILDKQVFSLILFLMGLLGAGISCYVVDSFFSLFIKTEDLFKRYFKHRHLYTKDEYDKEADPKLILSVRALTNASALGTLECFGIYKTKAVHILKDQFLMPKGGKYEPKKHMMCAIELDENVARKLQAFSIESRSVGFIRPSGERNINLESIEFNKRFNVYIPEFMTELETRDVLRPKMIDTMQRHEKDYSFIICGAYLFVLTQPWSFTRVHPAQIEEILRLSVDIFNEINR